MISSFPTFASIQTYRNIRNSISKKKKVNFLSQWWVIRDSSVIGLIYTLGVPISRLDYENYFINCVSFILSGTCNKLRIKVESPLDIIR